MLKVGELYRIENSVWLNVPEVKRVAFNRPIKLKKLFLLLEKPRTYSLNEASANYYPIIKILLANEIRYLCYGGNYEKSLIKISV